MPMPLPCRLAVRQRAGRDVHVHADQPFCFLTASVSYYNTTRMSPSMSPRGPADHKISIGLSSSCLRSTPLLVQAYQHWRDADRDALQLAETRQVLLDSSKPSAPATILSAVPTSASVPAARCCAVVINCKHWRCCSPAAGRSWRLAAAESGEKQSLPSNRREAGAPGGLQLPLSDSLDRCRSAGGPRCCRRRRRLPLSLCPPQHR